MAAVPASIARFLAGRRIVVAGVSRNPKQTANTVYRTLRRSGYETIAVNPHASEVEGVTCYPNLAAVPGKIDGVMIVTHPQASLEVVRQAGERGVGGVWFHRAIGGGSVSDAAVRECEARGIPCIVGGCPLMYCEPVDVAHRCFRWWLRWRGKLPL